MPVRLSPVTERFSPWRFCVAPMMDCTDRHYRYFARLLSRRARLYTEMITAAALVHGNAERLLRHDALEHPLALQLGGSDPGQLAQAARLGEAAGHCEINLNVGCPSERVQSGRFGACLIAEPRLVAECVAAMAEAVTVPVTVKTRLGVDEHDSYEHLCSLVEGVAQAGCSVILLHARKAILGLDTRDNRRIPPLDYERVRRLKRDFPSLTVVLNGGLTSLAAARAELPFVDGVMLGRASYETPWLLAGVDAELFGENAPFAEPSSAVDALLPYLLAEIREGTPARHVTRHLLGFFAGQPGAREWRRTLSEDLPRSHDPAALLMSALQRMQAEWPESHAAHPGRAQSGR